MQTWVKGDLADDADDVDDGMKKTKDNSKNLGSGWQHRIDFRRHCWVLSLSLEFADLDIFCVHSEDLRLLKFHQL